MTKITIVLLAATFLTACRDGEVRTTALPPNHPANADAQEAAFVVPNNPLIDEAQIDATVDAVVEDVDTQLSAEMQERVDQLFAAYLALSEMLARDEHGDATSKFASILGAARALGTSDHDPISGIAGRITEAAEGKADELKAARDTFKAVSPHVVELARVAPPSKDVAETIREAYCPMVDASWLQTAEAVNNPYYGSQMLRCGEISRTIQSKGMSHDH